MNYAFLKLDQNNHPKDVVPAGLMSNLLKIPINVLINENFSLLFTLRADKVISEHVLAPIHLVFFFRQIVPTVS